MNFDFLTIEDVLILHANQIETYGGDLGVRDPGLLESALAQPPSGAGGQYFHADVFAMAAAYLFHLVQNHPFIDGNKRTALVAALTFLDFNGVEINVSPGELYELTMAVATGQKNKDTIAEFFRIHAH